VTNDIADAIRTPDELLADLPDFPWEPRHRQWDGLRLAHIDEGDGAPVVFFHGEPTWSFLWRKVIPPVRDAGFRCIAGDMPGFGRSDKPLALDWYSYDRHTAAMAALLEHLDVRCATAVVHDWGGPIGLRLAVEHPERIARMVILDTGLFTGHQRMTDAWMAFREFVERTVDLPVGMLVERACHARPDAEVIAAYDAPFPTPQSKAGARAFPLMLPLAPDRPGAEAGQRVLAALAQDHRPKLTLWADSDPVLPLSTGERFAAAIGTSIDHVIAGAGHFLQEDRGPEVGALIASWLTDITAA
jgi:haloalkane dehalogenase